jgi:hypothetical protein
MFKKYQEAVKPKLTEHDDLMKYAGAGVQRLSSGGESARDAAI